MRDITKLDRGAIVTSKSGNSLKRVFSLFAVLALVLTGLVSVESAVLAADVPFSTAPVDCFDGTSTAIQAGKCGGINHSDQEGFALEVTTTKANEEVEIPVGADEVSYAWQIEWESGATESQSGTSGEGKTIKHTYPVAGTHTVKITPNGNVELGWFDAFGNFESNSSSGSFITKILTPFSELSRTPAKGFYRTFRYFVNATNLPNNLFASFDTSEVTDFSYMFYFTFHSYARNSTSATIPEGLFNSISTGDATNFSNMFSDTFNSFAYNSTKGTIPNGLFNTIETASGVNFSYMFNATFYSYAQNSTVGTIPADLFSSIVTNNGVNFSNMFFDTFYTYARNSTSGTIPEGLFDSIYTPKGTNFSYMFNYTFGSYAYASTKGTIPATLFAAVDTTIGTNFNYMFTSTFDSYAYNSTSATIPEGLFSSIRTSRSANFSHMFTSTFSSYARNSTNGTIPATLFATIDTSNGTNFSNMFSSTFCLYAYNSTSATIPASLFSSIDTTSGAYLSGMFNYTFYYYAHNSTSGTIPSGLFDSIDTVNGTHFSYMFSATFSYYANKSLSGTIPSGLFKAISTSNGIDFNYMFDRTFSNYANVSTKGTIPSGLFNSINTANGTFFSSMFSATFSYYAHNAASATVPDGLFKSINTDNAIDDTDMYRDTFTGYGITKPTPEPAPLIHALPAVNADYATKFRDIGVVNAGRQTAIKWLYQHDITTGSPSGSNTYKPSDKVNRGAMAQFMHKLRGLPKITKTIPKIADLGKITNKDRVNSINWLASEGITVIGKDNKYNPSNPVTRGAMAEFLYKLAGAPAYTPSIEDCQKVKDINTVKNNPERQKAIAWLVKNKISIPDEKGNFNPTNSVNRGSMAEFLMKLYKMYVK